jgi:hypothetical protein
MKLRRWPPRRVDPAYWLERAKYARRAAANMTDPELKRRMLEVVAGYERLAKRAEEQKSGAA